MGVCCAEEKPKKNKQTTVQIQNQPPVKNTVSPENNKQEEELQPKKENNQVNLPINNENIITVEENNNVEPNQEIEKLKSAPNQNKAAVDELLDSSPLEKPYKIKIQEEGKIIGEGEFDCKKTINEVITSSFSQNIDEMDVFINNINVTNNIQSQLIEIISRLPESQEYIIDLYGKLLEIPDDIKTAYSNDCCLRGSIFFNDEGGITIPIYNTLQSNLTVKKFAYDELLQTRGPLSAYCNGKNCIFISGGENQNSICNQESLNDFYLINLENINSANEGIEKQGLPNLNIARHMHSMIYIPYDYIFIVGGVNTKSVELYKLSTNNIKVHSELNEIRLEPTLCLFQNRYLIVFCGLNSNQTFNKTIEYCDLLSYSKQWFNLEYKISNDIQFNPSFFGCAYLNQNIILLGANEIEDEKKKSYLFYLSESNEFLIDEVDLNNEETGVFKEKFLIPYNQNNSITIPINDPNNINILSFNEDEAKIEIINCNPNDNQEDKESRVIMDNNNNYNNYNIDNVNGANGADNQLNNDNSRFDGAQGQYIEDNNPIQENKDIQNNE